MRYRKSALHQATRQKPLPNNNAWKARVRFRRVLLSVGCTQAKIGVGCWSKSPGDGLFSGQLSVHIFFKTRCRIKHTDHMRPFQKRHRLLAQASLPFASDCCVKAHLPQMVDPQRISRPSTGRLLRNRFYICSSGGMKRDYSSTTLTLSFPTARKSLK